MNNYIGPANLDSRILLFFQKSSHLNRPGPANTFVIIDESGPTINDGFFATDDGYLRSEQHGRSKQHH
jgi:hypothetical protein